MLEGGARHCHDTFYRAPIVQKHYHYDKHYLYHYPIAQKHYLHDCVQAQPHVGLHEHNDHRNDQFPGYLAAFCGTINHDDDDDDDDDWLPDDDDDDDGRLPGCFLRYDDDNKGRHLQSDQ